ncbi:MAG: multicopper oxidase family protein [Mycobacterium sp.]|uniref:multicopper oxidase family protein n=1 Tax=Mycobacterium sp. TaxID=1785 RepID=UPI001EBB0BC7|nr:multicopper oxidase family protein [Mycobacterium sp.]MBW0017256.1 multicopper oxidase family protein [Mycobacterium sp.]
MPVLPTRGVPFDSTQVSRRGFLVAGIAGGFALTGCGPSDPKPAANAALDSAIAAAEAARPHSGRTVNLSLTPQPATIDLGGVIAQTQAFGDAIPGPLIRASIGDELVIKVTNRLDQPTSVHWHGITLRNDMDGAEPATPNIPAGQEFTYRFSVPDPGTYWAHPHVGLQDDLGLYLPIVIDDPTESVDYDAEWIVVLDDWTDGVGKSPQQLLDELTSPNKPSMPMQTSTPTTSGTTTTTSPTTITVTPGTGTSPATATPAAAEAEVGKSDLLGGDAGDIDYPYYLINGRIPAAPTTFDAKSGQRIRIRFINAGADTAFRVALAGHSMTVTHTDGYPVVPTQVDALLIGMAERYDVIVTAADGIFPLVAAAEGKNAVARALLSTGTGSVPDPNFRPAELTRRVGTVEMFTATAPADLGRADASLTLPVVLGGNMMKYDWTINGQPYSRTDPLHVREGQRPTLAFDNQTMMFHPMHLHGHTFQIVNPDGSPGARKDTVIVLPNQKLNAVLVADNPGVWMFHCHNKYHQDAGMQTRIDYLF